MMKQSQEEQYSGIPVFTLSELNTAIKATLELAFPEMVWVVAEISEIRHNSKGHCYLELVEREEEETLAQIRANIWAYTFRNLASKFEKATGESLKQGMKVLLQVTVTFHEVYGLSLNVKDIDPTYSLGEMARKKREVIERLTKEGLINLNKQIHLSLVPQRIAVISSETAAGYGDFINHLDDNPYGYKIFYTLYQSLMQGQEAEASIIAALKQIREHIKLHDAVVIIRGGGSQIDLSCFDTYSLAVEVAKFPLPAKELLREENHRLQYLVQQFRHIVRERFNSELSKIETALHRLIHGTTQIIDGNNNKLKLDMNRLVSGLKILFQEHKNKIKHFDQAIRLLDPINVLKRGYSVTYLKEKTIKDSGDLQEGDIIRTKLYKGRVTSKVEGLDVEE
jgi:exodeoxyribonuclease VII large subunit